jgi:hypothetical protein
VFLPFLSIFCGESCLLVSWCAGDRFDMAGSDEDHGRSRRPGAEDEGWSSTCRVLGGQAIKRSGDAMCVCAVYKETRSVGFLVWPQKQGRWFVSSLTSKSTGTGFPVWASKLAATVCQWFGLKTTGTGFLVWASKSAVMVW